MNVKAVPSTIAIYVLIVNAKLAAITMLVLVVSAREVQQAHQARALEHVLVIQDLLVQVMTSIWSVLLATQIARAGLLVVSQTIQIVMHAQVSSSQYMVQEHSVWTSVRQDGPLDALIILPEIIWP